MKQYTIKEVAKILGLGNTTLYHLHQRKILTFHRKGNELYLTDEDLIAFFGIGVNELREYKYSIKHAAAELGYSYGHFVVLVRNNKVPSMIIGGRARLNINCLKNSKYDKLSK